MRWLEGLPAAARRRAHPRTGVRHPSATRVDRRRTAPDPVDVGLRTLSIPRRSG